MFAPGTCQPVISQLAGGLRTSGRLPIALWPGQLPCDYAWADNPRMEQWQRISDKKTHPNNFKRDGWGAGLDTQQWAGAFSKKERGRGGNCCQQGAQSIRKVVGMKVQSNVNRSWWSTGMAGKQHPCSPAQAGTNDHRLSLNGLLRPQARCEWVSQERLPGPFNIPGVVGGQI